MPSSSAAPSPCQISEEGDDGVDDCRVGLVRVPLVEPFASSPKWSSASRPTAAGPVQLRVDRPGGLRRQPGNALELLLARAEHALGRAEVLQQRAPPHRADALERVEERLARPRRAALAVEVEREAVRLVPDPLQQLQARAVRVEQDRVGAAGHEDLLDPLGERDHRHARQVVRLHRRQRGRELPLAAVDHDEVRRRREPLVVVLLGARAQAGEAARDDLGHRGEVVLAVEAAHGELAVVRLLRPARPGRRPSSRRSPAPGCSRCRSTRSGAAGSRG